MHRHCLMPGFALLLSLALQACDKRPAAAPTGTPAAAPSRWEYKTISLARVGSEQAALMLSGLQNSQLGQSDAASLLRQMAKAQEKTLPVYDRMLNELGQEGWELCGVGAGQADGLLIFKRPGK
jgi:hypothetical protein